MNGKSVGMILKKQVEVFQVSNPSEAPRDLQVTDACAGIAPQAQDFDSGKVCSVGGKPLLTTNQC